MRREEAVNQAIGLSRTSQSRGHVRQWPAFRQDLLFPSKTGMEPYMSATGIEIPGNQSVEPI
jgi:hypothetical protein